MMRRRTLVGLIILVAAALVIFMLFKLAGSRSAEESPLATDVAVHVGKVIRTTLHRYVSAYGSVDPEPASNGKPPAAAFIGSPASGILVQINCTEGRKVSKGDVLFRLDSRVAEVAFEKAKKQLAFAEQTYARQKKLLEADGTSQKSFQEAESQINAARSELSAAQTQLSLLQIEAPLKGTLVKLNAELGQFVESNTALAEIIDLDRLIVTADVPSREARLLNIGQLVEFGSGDSPKGTLFFISKNIDPGKDTVLIRASIPPTLEFFPGHFLNIRIICDEHRDCLSVPEESLISTEEGDTWIMIVQGDQAVRMPVQAGFREGGLVEVEGEGLTEGMIIVTEEAYSLPPVTKINIINR